MKKNFIDLVTAGSAIKQLVSNVEGTDYDFSFIPVDVKLSNRMEHFQMFVIYKKGNYDEVVNEINKKVSIDIIDSFLKPSENYVQIAFYESDDTPNYKRSITFCDSDEKLQKYEMQSCIVDENYQYINNVMNRWFAFDEKLEVHKSDDIYQFIDCVSKKQVKKEKGFGKKLFKKK